MSYLVELKSFLFSTRRKRVDLYLFLLLIVVLWAGRGPFNAWLVETVGERMATVSTFFVDYPWLLYCLCALIVLGTGLYILNHIQDHYRSRRSMMVILLLANIFIASAGYWDHSAHTSIAHALVYIYELEMNEEHENGAEGKTLVGSMTTAKHLLEKNFAQFISVTVPDTDELFRDNSYFQDLVKSNVLVVDTEDGPFVGSNLIADAILAYCTAHKGHKKQEAALKYSLPPDTPVQSYIPASIHNEAMLSGAWTSIAQ